MKSSKKEIIITKKNYSSVICLEEEFRSSGDYLKYKNMVKKFKNNNKYYFEFDCFKCENRYKVFHWTIKCSGCKFRFDILNSFLKQQELTLNGYWNSKNVMMRFKDSSIYI